MSLKHIGVIAIVLALVMVLGCVESQPSTPTSIENPKSTVASTPAPTQAQSQNIIISYSAKKVNSIGEYSQAATGKVFLVITMNIENHGYKSFSTGAAYFSVIANNVKYDASGESYLIDGKLDSVDLLDGGSTKGNIVFEVPSNIGSYQLQYSGFGDYNIIYKVF